MGKDDPIIAFDYSLSMAIGLCQGPVDNIVALYADDRILLDESDTIVGYNVVRHENFWQKAGGVWAEEGQGSVQLESGILGYIVGILGLYNYNASSTHVRMYQAAQETELVPYFRGLCAIMFYDLIIGIKPKIPKWSALVTRVHTRQDGIAQWNDDYAQIDESNRFWDYQFEDPMVIPSVAWAEVDVIDNANGVMNISINGEVATYTASSNTLQQISNALVAAINANVGAGAVVTATNGGGTTTLITITHDTPDGDYFVLWIHGAVGETNLSTVREPSPVPINGWLAAAPGPFGTEDAVAFPRPIATAWAKGTGIWIRRPVQMTRRGRMGIVVTVTFDNALWVYLNGRKVQEFNITNAQVGLQTETFFVDAKTSASTQELAFFCTDEAGATTDGSYLQVNINNVSHMNPAHIIRECLTDPDWGMGYPEADVDETSFAAVALALYEEGFGISILWDKTEKLETFVQDIARHIDAALYVDRITGKFVLKLIREDYTIGTLPIIDKSNAEKVTDFSRPSLSELTNSLSLHYWSSDTDELETVTVQDIALAQEQGIMISTEVTYSGIPNFGLANVVAHRDLLAQSTPLASCTVYTKKSIAGDFNIGDVFKLTWEEFGFDEVIMRVIEVNYGTPQDPKIQIRCIQDIYTLPTTSYLSSPIHAALKPPDHITNWILFETPYFELVSEFDRPRVNAALALYPTFARASVAIGRLPSLPISGTEIHVDEGTGYNKVMDGLFCHSMTINSALAKTTVSVVCTGSVPTNIPWGQIGNELIRVDSYVESTGVMTFSRGMYDTVPEAHAQDERIYFWSAVNQSSLAIALNVPVKSTASLLPGEYVETDSIDVKIAPLDARNNLYDIATATPKTLVMVARANRPYPPMNVQFNALDFPSTTTGNIVVTWGHDDRQDYLNPKAWGDTASVTAELGTTYTIRVYEGTSTLQRTVTGETGTTWTYTAAMESADGGPFATITIEIESVRGGEESSQLVSHFMLR